MRTFEHSEAFLRYAHARFPGTTPKAFDVPLAPGTGPETSYDKLITVIPEAGPLVSVVDLACGDGFLCQRLLEERSTIASLVGVDLSEAELDAARHRLYGHAVGLCRARAQALPLHDSSVDYVLCHMALMLMESLEQVIDELRRVLKPGGVFSAVVPRGWARGPVLDIFLANFKAVAGHHRIASFHQLGDPQVRSIEAIEKIFFVGNDFRQPIATCEFELAGRHHPHALADMFMGGYEAACLSDRGNEELRQELVRGFERIAEADGRVPFALGLRQISASRL